MKQCAIIVFAVCVAVWVLEAEAQTAEQSFHDAAQEYVGGRLAQAGELVESGLAQFPGDPKLVALKALIDEEKERQQQSGDEFLPLIPEL